MYTFVRFQQIGQEYPENNWYLDKDSWVTIYTTFRGKSQRQQLSIFFLIWGSVILV